MHEDARERAKWKVRLSRWIDELPPLIKRPVAKLMADTVFGILTSGSLQQSQIARALREPGRLHHTQKRLSRMLAGHSEVAWAAEQLQLQQLGPAVDSEMILAIDPGDLPRRCAQKRASWLGARWGPGGSGGRLSADERGGAGCQPGCDAAADHAPAQCPPSGP